MKSSNLNKKMNYYKFFSLYVQTSEETTCYQRSRETILNRAKKYYDDNNEVLTGKARNKYRKLSEVEKNIKREYGRTRYHNMSEEKKERNTKGIPKTLS